MAGRMPGSSSNTGSAPPVKCGIITFGDVSNTTPCVVKDMSAQGARLRVESPERLPDRFDLTVDIDDFSSHCIVVGRAAKEVRVRFRPPVVKGQAAAACSAGTGKASAVFGVRQGKPPMPQSPAAAKPVAPQPAARAPAAAGPAPSGSAGKGPIVIAEDDPDDRLLIQDAFLQCDAAPPLEFVKDGQELLDYLNGREEFLGKPWPSLILLDLNMPRIDGRKALVRIKSNPAFRSIPLIVLTTSSAQIDINRTYELGASSYIQKPSTYSELVEMAGMLTKFWMAFATASGSGTRPADVVLL